MFISTSALLLAGAWLSWGLQKRKLIQLRKKHYEENGGITLQHLLSQHERQIDTFKIYTADELNKATHNYDDNKILGQGGQGTVYMGELPDTTIVAIKKSNAIDKSQVDQFVNEVVVLSQTNHRNVVKLLGCCLETEIPVLVYEFIKNGTLFDHIQKDHTPQMPWATRLRIASEIAGALSYLHSEAAMPIIHRDIKTTNILLDVGYISKVSDFGTSKFAPFDKRDHIGSRNSKLLGSGSPMVRPSSSSPNSSHSRPPPPSNPSMFQPSPPPPSNPWNRRSEAVETANELYVHHSDNPSSSLSTTPLDEPNYVKWRRSVEKKNNVQFVVQSLILKTMEQLLYLEEEDLLVEEALLADDLTFVIIASVLVILWTVVIDCTVILTEICILIHIASKIVRVAATSSEQASSPPSPSTLAAPSITQEQYDKLMSHLSQQSDGPPDSFAFLANIDECTLYNSCTVTCNNLQGSYNCSSCLKGYEGDGWKNGTGCVLKPLPTSTSSSDRKFLH
ncbi:hypothetical protein V2J09_023499 [Rumex salicifolius]